MISFPQNIFSKRLELPLGDQAIFGKFRFQPFIFFFFHHPYSRAGTHILFICIITMMQLLCKALVGALLCFTITMLIFVLQKEKMNSKILITYVFEVAESESNHGVFSSKILGARYRGQATLGVNFLAKNCVFNRFSSLGRLG